MIPAVFADTTLSIAKDFLIAREVTRRRPGVRILRWAYCFMVPLLLVLSALTVWLTSDENSPDWFSLLGWSLLASGTFWILGTAFLVKSLKEKWIRYVAFTAFQTVLAAWAYAILILLILAIEPSVEKWPVWHACILAICIFCPVYFLVTFPPEGPSAIILLPPKYEYKTATSTVVALFLALIIAFLSVINYPMNARIGAVVLKVFGIGGHVPIIICFKNTFNFTPPPLMELDQNRCSKELSVLFDGGDRIYVTNCVFRRT